MSTFRSRRGLTLVEMMISVGIVVTAMAASASILIQSSNLMRNANEVAESNDAARLGGERVVTAARVAGMGSPGGIWVLRNNTPTLINSVFGYDGNTGAGYNPATANANGYDELWIVAPNVNAMTQGCYNNDSAQAPAVGASSWVKSVGVGVVLNVTCTAAFKVNTPILVSDWNSAALLTPIGTPIPETTTSMGVVDYAERSQNLAPNQRTGFGLSSPLAPMDVAMGVRILHYYVGPTSTGTGLFQANAVPGSDAARPGIPFKDVANSAVLVQDRVEDFQVAFGIDGNLLGNPDQYTFQNGLLPDYNAGVRALRISVVSRAKLLAKTDQGKVITSLVPLAVENHTPTVTAANTGYRRSVYRRRVELVNLALSQL